MDKVFLNHLHGDHLNDLSHIYGSGPRRTGSPHCMSGDLGLRVYYAPPGETIRRSITTMGTRAFCQNLREALAVGHRELQLPNDKL